NSGSATAGYSDGSSNPDNTYQMPGSQTSGAFLDSNSTTGLVNNQLNSNAASAVPPSNTPVPGRYIFNVDNGQPQAPTSMSALLSGGGQSNATSLSVLCSTPVTASA